MSPKVTTPSLSYGIVRIESVSAADTPIQIPEIPTPIELAKILVSFRQEDAEEALRELIEASKTIPLAQRFKELAWIPAALCVMMLAFLLGSTQEWQGILAASILFVVAIALMVIGQVKVLETQRRTQWLEQAEKSYGTVVENRAEELAVALGTEQPFALLLLNFQLEHGSVHYEDLDVVSVPTRLEYDERWAAAVREVVPRNLPIYRASRVENLSVTAPVSRVVLADETWPKAIRGLMEHASMVVVLFTGDSPGLRLELEIIKQDPSVASRCVLVHMHRTDVSKIAPLFGRGLQIPWNPSRSVELSADMKAWLKDRASGRPATAPQAAAGQ